MLNNEQLVSPGMRLLIPDRYFQGIDFPIRKLTNRKIGSPDEPREILLQLPFANHIDLPGNNKLGVKAYEFVDLEYTLGAVTGENWFFYGGNDARDESNQSHPTFRSQSNERIRYFYQLPSCSCFRVPSPWTFVLTPHNVRAVQIPPGTGRKPIVYYPASAFMSNADFLLQSGWLFSRPCPPYVG